MAQREDKTNGQIRLIISHNLRSTIDPSIRVQISRRFTGVHKDTPRADREERALLKEATQRLAEMEGKGLTWSKLLQSYEQHVRPLLARHEWVQSEPTFEDAISSLYRWTEDWMEELAANISSADVTRLFHKMKKCEKADSFIQKVRGDLKKVFEFGIAENLIRGIERSPTIGVSVKSRARKRREILSESEIKKLLIYAREYEPDWYYIWAFAIYTGCRNGELYALKWSDIDDKNGLIHIQRSFNRKKKEYKDTKTGEWRDVSICPPLKEIIKELRLRRQHENTRGNSKFGEFVLPRPGIWQNSSQAEKLRNFCNEIGITPVCFHSLRACFATELLRRGVPVAMVMKLGGWSSMKTMMHYVRLSGIEIQGATDSLDFRTSKPDRIAENRNLMNAVGERFEVQDKDVRNVVPLRSRKLPSGLYRVGASETEEAFQ